MFLLVNKVVEFSILSKAHNIIANWKLSLYYTLKRIQTYWSIIAIAVRWRLATSQSLMIQSLQLSLNFSPPSVFIMAISKMVRVLTTLIILGRVWTILIVVSVSLVCGAV